MGYSVLKLEIFVPESHFQAVREALWSVDAGHIGRYDRCLSWSRVESCWRTLEDAAPFCGTVGMLTQAQELKIEVCCREDQLQRTLEAIKWAHPYEEPVINVLPLRGTGL